MNEGTANNVHKLGVSVLCSLYEIYHFFDLADIPFYKLFQARQMIAKNVQMRRDYMKQNSAVASIKSFYEVRFYEAIRAVFEFPLILGVRILN